MQRKILIMGCGGIGSWLAEFLEFARRNSIIRADVTLADGDRVELKNLLWQRFESEDIGKNKTEVLAKRYHMKALPEYITSSRQLRPFDLVITTTDNEATRHLVYRTKKQWIDARCSGSQWVVFSSRKPESRQAAESLPSGSKMKTRHSCQGGEHLQGVRVKFGFLMAAAGVMEELSEFLV